MHKNLLYLLLISLFFIDSNDREKQSSLYTIELQNTSELKEFFAYTGNDMRLISAHRGGAKNGLPENSFASFEYTLTYTPATFEVDPRLTKDSVIVLMHDATLERTTNGTGKVADHTWGELQQLKLKDSKGEITEYRIPTLDEVIEWSEGKTVINLDKKDVSMEMTAQKIIEHEAQAHVIITVHNAKEAKYYYEKNKNFMFSAWIKTKKAFEEYARAIPWEQVAQAYIGSKVTPENQELVKLLHQQGVMVMIGAGPSYDKQQPEKRRSAYRKLIQSGIDIIESDRPVEVAKAIRPLLPKDSPKQKFFGGK